MSKFFAIAAILAALGLSFISHAQGPLDPPPGVPAPNMKTLQELWDKLDAVETSLNNSSSESRTPISSLPVTIDTPGSYYFTQDLEFSAATGHAIEITADHVTLDLNGFRLSSTDAVTGNGVHSTKSFGTIKNGNIVGKTTVSNIGTTWDVDAKGFSFGIRVLVGRSNRVDGLTVSGCRLMGIEAGGNSQVTHCVASQNGAGGFTTSESSTISHSISSQNGAGFLMLTGGVISACSSTENKSNGFSLDDVSMNSCMAFKNGGAGIDSRKGVVSNCVSNDNGTFGIVNSGPSLTLIIGNFVSGNGTAQIAGGPEIDNAITP